MVRSSLQSKATGIDSAHSRTLTERTEKLQRRDTRRVFRQVEESTFSLELEDQDLADAVSILSDEPSVNFEVDQILLNSPLYRKVYGDRYLKRAQRLSRATISPRNSLQPTPKEPHQAGHRRQRSRGSAAGGEAFLANIPGGVPFLGVPFKGEQVEDDSASGSEIAISIKDTDTETLKADNIAVESEPTDNGRLSIRFPNTSSERDDNDERSSTTEVQSNDTSHRIVNDQATGGVRLPSKDSDSLGHFAERSYSANISQTLDDGTTKPDEDSHTMEDRQTPGAQALVTLSSHLQPKGSIESDRTPNEFDEAGISEQDSAASLRNELTHSEASAFISTSPQTGDIEEAEKDDEHAIDPQPPKNDLPQSTKSEDDTVPQPPLSAPLNTPTIIEPQNDAPPTQGAGSGINHSNPLNIDFGGDLDLGIATPSSEHSSLETFEESLVFDSPRPTEAMISELREEIYQKNNGNSAQVAQNIIGANSNSLSTPTSPVRRSASVRMKPAPSPPQRPRELSSTELPSRYVRLRSRSQTSRSSDTLSPSRILSSTTTGQSNAQSPTEVLSPRLPVSNIDLRRLSLPTEPPPPVNIRAPTGPPPPVPKREPPPIPKRPSEAARSVTEPSIPSIAVPPVTLPSPEMPLSPPVPAASPPKAPSMRPPPIPTISPQSSQGEQAATIPVNQTCGSSKILRHAPSNSSISALMPTRVEVASSGDSATGDLSTDAASTFSASTSPTTTRSSNDRRSIDSNSYQTNTTSALGVPSALTFNSMGLEHDPEARLREKSKISGVLGRHLGAGPENASGDNSGKKLPLRRSFARLSGRFGSDKNIRIKLLNEAARDGFVSLLDSCLQVSSARDVQTPVALEREASAKTPLMRASARGHLPCMERLVKAGADFATADRQGRIALHHAILEGQAEAVRWMAERFRLVTAYPGVPLPPGPLEITNTDGQGSLAIAAATGRVDIIEILIGAGANLDGGDRQNRTALFAAITNEHADVASVLVSRGAHINHKDKLQDTPLLCAARSGPPEIVTMLLSAGADRTAKDENGDAAIHHAARHGQLEILEMLYMTKEDLEVKNNIGERPLHAAAAANSFHVVKALLLVGCEPNAWTEPPAKRRRSLPLASAPLHYACRGGHYDVANALIDHGAAVISNLEDGTSPLMLAVEACDLATVVLLLERGVSVNAANSSSNLTALHMAVMKPGSLDIVKQLLNFGANPQLRNKRNETPLVYALNNKFYDPDAVKYLSKYDFHVSYQSLRRNQPGYSVPSVPSNMFYGGSPGPAAAVNVDAGSADPEFRGYFHPQPEITPGDAPPAYHTLPPRPNRSKPG